MTHSITIKHHVFSTNPDAVFEEGGTLHGFMPAHVSELDTRWSALVEVFRGDPISPEDEEDDYLGLSDEDTMLQHPDGRRAIVGLTCTGHRFVVED